MKRFLIGISILFLAISYGPNSSMGIDATFQQEASALMSPGQEELLGEMNPAFKYTLDWKDYCKWESVVSPDGKQIVWGESLGGKPWIVLCNGQPLGPQLDSTWNVWPEIYFTNDSQHLLAKGWVRKKVGRHYEGEFVVLLDGKDQRTELGEINNAVLSPDGKKFACVLKNGTLLVNGQKIAGPFEDIASDSSILYSTDSSHLGCIVHLKGGKHAVIVDGREQIIDDPTIDSLDLGASGHFELIVNRDDSWSYIIDGQENPAFDVLGQLVFSSDGKRYAYGGALDKHRMLSNRAVGMIVMDGKPGPEYKGAINDSVLNAFLKMRVTLRKGLVSFSSHYHGVSNPIFSKDGLHVAYAVRQDSGKTVVIRDGQPGPTFDEYCDDLAFSPDGSHLACVGTQAGKLVEVRDGITTSEFDTISRDAMGLWLSWLPDGQRTAFIAWKYIKNSKDHYWAIVDGKPTKMYKCLGMSNPIFSPSGKHWACRIRDLVGLRDYRSFVIIDGVESKIYGDVIEGSLLFLDDETLAYVAREDHKFYRVTQRLF